MASPIKMWLGERLQTLRKPGLHPLTALCRGLVPPQRGKFNGGLEEVLRGLKKQSVGILLFRRRGGNVEVFLVHPGGPFWAKKDEGAWSIPKGLVEEGEGLLEAAKREFREETGHEVDGEFTYLGEVRLASGKIVHAWALEKDLDPNMIVSNKFSMEWPKGSGILQEFPEVDRAGWFTLEEARRKMHPAQAEFLDRLVRLIGGGERTGRGQTGLEDHQPS
jgi:predicted NUDIX family NTP pyrophosphohydrolase